MTADTMMIHVRFGNDGSVVEISERPASLSPPEWFKALSEAAPNLYQALSGGRGVFRLGKDQLDAARAKVVASEAA